MTMTSMADQRLWTVDETLEYGLRQHEAGRPREARAAYVAVLAQEPDHADALHLLGVVTHQTGRADLAAHLIRRALELNPADARYHNNLGNALRDLGRAGEAIGHFGAALRLRPDSPGILCNLGNAFRDVGDLEEALAVYRSALAIDPALAEGWYNLANLLCDIDRPAEAEAPYRRALLLRPGYADAHYNLGNALVRLCRPREAEGAYRAALRLRGDHAETHNNLGVTLQELGRLDEAEACFRAALRLKPGDAETHYNLGCALSARNRLDEAIALHARALELKPDHGAARLALCMAHLPILATDEAEIAVRRRAYEDQLRRLAAEPPSPALADAVGSSQPFFLPCHGQDDRALQSLHGALACRLMAARFAEATLPAPPAPGRKLRLGLVSGFFHDHTVWKLFLEGWLKHLDRDRFELFGYHTGSKRDGWTDVAAGACRRFIEGRREGWRWREIILADAPDILLYPEVGMDPMAAQLAAQRLAPVQCVAWGQPETTGMPTMDYFLSSGMMEPPGAEDHYTERLIRLPNLGTCYENPTWPAGPPQREALGLRPDAMVYWSGQALHKYHPQYDEVFPRIAREVEDCQFVFIRHRSHEVTALFQARLERAFAAFGQRVADHCVILPPLPQERFIAAVRQCDVMLDTIGWSGGKSTLDCLAHDAPIVTLPSPFLRGRHTAAILRRIGVIETIAASVDEYVDLAVLLARDGWWRSLIQEKMAAGRHRAFGDRACLAALEDFLEAAARGQKERRGA